MNLEESDKLTVDIKHLSNLLIAGFNDCRRFKDKAKDKDLIGEKLDQFIASIGTELQNWINETMDYLRSKSNYYQYHFMAHNSGSSVYIGMSEKVSNLIITWEAYLRNLEDIILRLEDTRNLQVRREIAEIENKADVVYEIKYNDHTREIKLNNIIIAKPDFESENERFFTYIYTKQNTPLEIKEIEDYNKVEFKKRISDIVRDLGFTGKLRQIFFPVVTQQKVLFVNPISRKYFIEKDLPPINLANLGGTARTSEVKSDKDTTK